MPSEDVGHERGKQRLHPSSLLFSVGGAAKNLLLPGIDGRETLVRLRALQPDLPVILCSGYAQQDEVSSLVSLPRL